MGSELTSLIDRVAALERQSRRQRGVLLLLAVALPLATWQAGARAQTTGPIVTADRFVVGIEGTRPSAVLGMRGPAVILQMNDLTGKERLLLSVNEKAPSLTWVDTDGARHERLPGARFLPSGDQPHP